MLFRRAELVGELLDLLTEFRCAGATCVVLLLALSVLLFDLVDLGLELNRKRFSRGNFAVDLVAAIGLALLVHRRVAAFDFDAGQAAVDLAGAAHQVEHGLLVLFDAVEQLVQP